MTTRFFSYPYASMRPRVDGKPAKRILIHPSDEPLPIMQLQLGQVWETSTCAPIAHIAPADVIDRIGSRAWILQSSVRPGATDVTIAWAERGAID